MKYEKKKKKKKKKQIMMKVKNLYCNSVTVDHISFEKSNYAMTCILAQTKHLLMT